MEPVAVSICMGTACVVMDGSRLVLLEEHLPAHLRDLVKIRGERCLDLCTRHTAALAPFVLVDGEPLANATFEAIVERVEARLASRR